jgi:hypothetical protein
MSRSPYTLYVGTNQTQRVKPVLMAEDEAQTLTVDLSAYCSMEETEIVSARWANLGAGTSASIGTPTTGTKTTTALVTVADGGDSEIQVSILLDNAEVLVFQFSLVNSDAYIAERTDYH